MKDYETDKNGIAQNIIASDKKDGRWILRHAIYGRGYLTDEIKQPYLEAERDERIFGVKFEQFFADEPTYHISYEQWDDLQTN